MIYGEFLSTDDMATLLCFHMGSCPRGLWRRRSFTSVRAHLVLFSINYLTASSFQYTFSLTLIIVVKWSGVLLLVVLMRPWLFQVRFFSSFARNTVILNKSVFTVRRRKSGASDRPLCVCSSPSAFRLVLR